MYFSVLLLQPEHPFLQKEQKHKEGQRKLLHADIAIPARVTCWRKASKASDLDQGWMDGWKVLPKRKKVLINTFHKRNSKYLQIKEYFKHKSTYK